MSSSHPTLSPALTRAPDLDLEFVRRQFPALETHWAFFDNAGGTLAPRQVIDRVGEYMSRYQIQLGASYPRSVEAGERIEAGRCVVAAMMGAPADSVILGPSTTANLSMLARSLRPLWQEGDNVVVTNLDHEANIGPWRRLEATGIEVREWRLDHETADLRWQDLEPLLDSRTRIVCFTHCSNVVGRITDVRSISERVHQVGGLVCVDGVGFAPHRRLDVLSLGVDVYAFSLYKTFGPHLAALFGKRDLLLAAKGANHFFVGEDQVPYKLEPGGVSHELCAGLVGVADYFAQLDAHHSPGLGEARRLERIFEAISRHEAHLAGRLLSFLGTKKNVRILGPQNADPDRRVAIIAFTVMNRKASEIPPLADSRQLAIRFGHFYAHRAIDDLGLLAGDGVVRISLAHYNTDQELDRLITALDQIL